MTNSDVMAAAKHVLEQRKGYLAEARHRLKTYKNMMRGQLNDIKRYSAEIKEIETDLKTLGYKKPKTRREG